MKVIKRTPRSEMVSRVLWKRIDGLAPELAEVLGAPLDAVETALNTYIYIVTNVEFENGDIDWHPACASDDIPTLVTKFLAYMDADVAPIERASGMIQLRDQPSDQALAPEPPGETEKNS